MTDNEPMPDEQTDRGEPVPIRYVGEVYLGHWPEPERAVLHAREGHNVFVRGADPCDPESGRVPVYEGDQVLVMEHISHMSVHTTLEGADGYMLSQRVVPVREECGKTIARTLRYGEHDDGRRAHVRPGNEFVLEEIQVNLDYVDEWEGQGVDGYVPLTPVLFTWMSFGPHHSDNERRYLLAAARRLDQAEALFQRVNEIRQLEPEGAPAVRRAAFALIGAVELAVVSLGRAVAMCTQTRAAIRSTVPVPTDITSRRVALREIRNAYEHIEDRALGTVQRTEHPDALTIFNHHEVLVDGVIGYGNHRLDLQSDIPTLIAATRQFLKDVAGRRNQSAT